MKPILGPIRQRLTLAALALALLGSLPATAQTYFTVDGLRYFVADETDTHCSLTRPGSGTYEGSITIPEQVTSEGRTYDVTAIEPMAFEGCTDLTNLTLPGTVTSIGSFAFSGCTGLTSMAIPDAVTSIGIYTFQGCTALTDVTLPASLTSIETYAFASCTALTDATIPAAVEHIGYHAFAGCTSLANLTLPRTVTSIESGAFSSCSSLTAIHVDEDNAAFTSTDGVLYTKDMQTLVAVPGGRTSVTLPGTLTTIEESAFEGCADLASVTLPGAVTSIGDYAFMDCSSLMAIYVDEDNTAYSSADGVLYTKDMQTLVAAPGGRTSVTLPGTVTRIESAAFINCTGLTTLTIPDAVTRIGSEAFMGCTGLTSVAIPDAVTRIGSRAFAECTSLASLTLPNALTSISISVFEGCTNLTTLTIGESVAEINESAFTGCGRIESIYSLSADAPAVSMYAFPEELYATATLYVPQGSLESYRTAYVWSNFLNLEEFATTGIAGPTADSTARPVGAYDPSGRRIGTPRRGLNLIRMNDGRTRKVYVK